MIKKPRGTKDLLPNEAKIWVYLENKYREVCRRFNYGEIRTPMFESTSLFHRGVGETTDIVQKEMYSVVTNRGKDEITLKPEGTAPVVRAFIENKLYADTQPSKYFYITDAFRHERPQAGRLRHFHQFGIEAFGSAEPTMDAEVIQLADMFLRELGIENLELHINSIGCKECRSNYNKVLREYLKDYLEDLCETCNDRFEKNPMRILDCKTDADKEAIKNAPRILDHICDECKDHFEAVKEYLGLMGIEYKVDPNIVRGLDYYNRTAFEFISGDIGAQSTVCGGGRYDGLVEDIGGPSTPGVGFGMGIERLVMVLEELNLLPEVDNGIEVYFVAMGENALKKSVELSTKLKKSNIQCEINHMAKSAKAQFKYANKVNARYSIVIGDDEIEKGIVNIKNMETGDQVEKSMDDLVEFFK
ncbi:MAG: histidine--tRNA ligase [Firmicutes bacterium]|jgi:histidyl-tRNA synthetase|nr:histidine--tRNA ligase [Bacillota bacterium]